MTTATTTATTRLHITPFTPDILPSVLPASIQPAATNISFHSLPTVPENNYGYVTLPTMEAEKVKKKLHGSMLKGKKFKVETARPEKKKLEQNEPEEVAPKKTASKKRKAEDGVLDGHELPSDRKVKRGWTESTDNKKERRKEEKRNRKEEKKAKSQAKSKYTENDECLFRTRVPPNKFSAVDEKQDKKQKKKKKSQESVVHEFANTVSHPNFLRSGTEGTVPTATFEEGKGWVDDLGNVKEQAGDRAQKSDYRPGKVAGATEKRKSKSEKTEKLKPAKEESSESENWTSSSGSSDDSDSDERAGKESSGSSHETSDGEQSSKPSHSITKSAPDPATSNEEESAASTNEQPVSKETHPLEDVFKRPHAPGFSEDKPENAQFSFFAADDDIEFDEDEKPTEPVEPQTPFAKEDLQTRGLRSAAPTPDTGLVGRKLQWNDSGADSMDVDDASINTPVSKRAGTDREESDFAKWFWENRGDNNRAWKKRRRDAAKEERQRENRRTGMQGKS